MINDQTQEYSEWDVEVAKRIACAVISYQAGMPYETLWQQHTDQKKKTLERFGFQWQNRSEKNFHINRNKQNSCNLVS